LKLCPHVICFVFVLFKFLFMIVDVETDVA
jgi:hypothetical protein